MEKKGELGSSVYFQKAPSSPDGTRKGKRINYKIEIVNQNLEEAIREVRTKIRENPEWHLNVQAVASHYKPQPSHFLPEPSCSMTEDDHSHPLRLPTPDPSTKTPLQRLKYTERQKKEHQDRLRAIKQKRLQLQVASLEKQIQAKLSRKTQESRRLREQRALLRDIQEKRTQNEKLREEAERKRREEQRMLHESSVAKVDMMRREKRRSRKREASENRSLSESSALELKFREFQGQVSKMQDREILAARYKTLRSASQASLRRRISQIGETRTIQTSHSAVRNHNI